MEVNVVGVKSEVGGALLFCLVLHTHTHTHTHTGISVLWSLTRFAGML